MTTEIITLLEFITSLYNFIKIEKSDLALGLAFSFFINQPTKNKVEVVCLEYN